MAARRYKSVVINSGRNFFCWFIICRTYSGQPSGSKTDKYSQPSRTVILLGNYWLCLFSIPSPHLSLRPFSLMNYFCLLFFSHLIFSGFDPTLVHVGFVMKESGTGKGTISEYFGWPLSIPLHQYSILIHLTATV